MHAVQCCRDGWNYNNFSVASNIKRSSINRCSRGTLLYYGNLLCKFILKCGNFPCFHGANFAIVYKTLILLFIFLFFHSEISFIDIMNLILTQDNLSLLFLLFILFFLQFSLAVNASRLKVFNRLNSKIITYFELHNTKLKKSATAADQ